MLSIITNECLYLNLSDLVLNLFWGLRCRSARDFVEPKFDRRELLAIENELKKQNYLINSPCPTTILSVLLQKLFLFNYCYVVSGLVICKQYYSDRAWRNFVQARSMYYFMVKLPDFYDFKQYIMSG